MPAGEKQGDKVLRMSRAEGKCTAKVGEEKWLNRGRMTAGKKIRRKVSENRKENEGDTSKDARERQRKEVGHTEVEPFLALASV